MFHRYSAFQLFVAFQAASLASATTCTEASLSNTGGYVPQCDANGNYTPLQCATTGYCWCVDTNGVEISGTNRHVSAATAIDCSAVPSCLMNLHSSPSGLLGAHRPTCNADGTYAPQQCWASTGQCWCVNQDGTEITGTRTSAGQSSFDCTALPSCIVAAFQASQSGLMGSFTPQCSADGSYAPQQCNPSTGYCWCSTAAGTVVAGTETAPGMTAVDCSNVPCLTAAASLSESGLVGAMIPQCDSDGKYSARQCNPSTGLCYCVDSTTGAAIAGTSSSTDCTNIPACLLEANAALIAGTAAPQCDESGNYLPKQCQGSTLPICHCVDSSGRQILGTLGTDIDCSNVPTCLLAAHSASNSGLLGSFIPRCSASGAYESQQCHASTGSCWCVAPSGIEIDGTRTGPGKPRFDCDNLPPCIVNAYRMRSQKLGGRSVPTCQENGLYNALQCSGSTGYCWCVDVNTGIQIEGTSTPPGGRTSMPQCDQVSKSSTGGKSQDRIVTLAVPAVAVFGAVSIVALSIYCFKTRRPHATASDGTSLIMDNMASESTRAHLEEISPM